MGYVWRPLGRSPSRPSQGPRDVMSVAGQNSGPCSRTARPPSRKMWDKPDFLSDAQNDLQALPAQETNDVTQLV